MPLVVDFPEVHIWFYQPGFRLVVSQPGTRIEFLDRVDGVMMGRAAYQEPWRLLEVDPLLFCAAPAFTWPKAAAAAFIPYIESELARGTRLAAMTRHMLGLFRGVPGARAFRRHLATEAVKAGAGAEVLAAAIALLAEADRELPSQAA